MLNDPPNLEGRICIEALSEKKFAKQREMLFDKDVIYEVLYQQGNLVIVRAIP